MLQSSMAAITGDAKSLMSNLGEVKIVKVKIDQSRVAHELRHHARRTLSTVVWLAGTPICIEHFVLEDYKANFEF